MNQLVEEFARLCLEYEKVSGGNEYKKINKIHDLIQRTFLKLKEEDNLNSLLPLLMNEREIVRLWAASKLLSFFDKQCRPVLEKIANSSSSNNMSAKIILDNYGGNKLSF